MEQYTNTLVTQPFFNIRMLSNRFRFKLVLTATVQHMNFKLTTICMCVCKCVVVSFIFSFALFTSPKMLVPFVCRSLLIIFLVKGVRVCMFIQSMLDVFYTEYRAVNLNLMHLFLCLYSVLCIFFHPLRPSLLLIRLIFISLLPFHSLSLSTLTHTHTNTFVGYGGSVCR